MSRDQDYLVNGSTMWSNNSSNDYDSEDMNNNNLNLDLDLDDTEKNSEKRVDTHTINDTASPIKDAVDWDNEYFDWSSMPLDSELPVILNNIQEEPPVLTSTPPVLPKHHSLPSPNSNLVADPKYQSIMERYGLNDQQLADMTHLKLTKLCRHAESSDFNTLKKYRRTVLNRQYAKSSRSKKNDRCVDLEGMVKTLQEQLREKDQVIEEKEHMIQQLMNLIQ